MKTVSILFLASTLLHAEQAYDKSVPKPTRSEVSYGPHSRHVLDFWQARSDKPSPLVLVIHGGGWNCFSKERIHRFVEVQALLDAGISVAANNYRLIKDATADGVTPPVKAPMHDSARALQFLRSKAAEWNIDTTRIGAAGACTSLWLAYHVPQTSRHTSRRGGGSWTGRNHHRGRDFRPDPDIGTEMAVGLGL